ncbi:MAG: PQQ-dependent sugar dehydrogenase, partial [bacterium]
MNRYRISIFLSLTLLISLISYAQLPIGYTATQIQSGYTAVMGTQFNADGTKMFVWQKDGQVFVSNWDGTQYVQQVSPVVDLSEEVGNWRDFGMIDIELDPNFDTNGYIYLSYMVDRHHLLYFGTPDYDANTDEYFNASITRLTRYTVNLTANPIVVDPNSRLVLLGESISTGVPLLHQSHAGGDILFGDDGTILMTTGDNASYSTVDTGSVGHTYYAQAITDGILNANNNVGAFRSQQLTSLCGKLLRLDPATGDGVSSNPFYDSNNPRSPESRIWATGLRNPFRASMQKGSGSTNPADGNPGIVYVADVGWNVWEDLHIFDKPGLNAGWPLYEGLTQHNGYWNAGTTDPDNNNELFRDNCLQPTSFADDPNPANRIYTHNRPEVAWRHGGSNEARVPWFDGTTPTTPRIGATGSPTTGNEFRGNTASGSIYIQGDSMGSSMNGKLWFTDYVRNWIQAASFTDGTQNWIDNITEIAPINFGSGIVHLNQSPLDGFIYYVNIFNGTVFQISFEGPTWTSEPTDMTVECDGTADPGGAYNTWLNSFSGTVLCGNATLSNDSTGLSDLCGSTGSVTVTFTLSDECGNDIKKQATFTIEDTEAPTFNESLPSNITVECDAIPSAVTLTASDTCGSASVVYSESSAAGSCANEEVITRT